MNKYRRSLLLALSLLLYVVLSSHPAQAHASLTHSTPADSSVLSSSPSEVTLWFDEPVVAKFSAVRLIDEGNQFHPGASVDPVQNEPNSLHVLLPPLAQGSYLLFWKALSNEDGHYSQGMTTFSVGVAGSGRPTLATSLPLEPSLIEALLRWINLLCLTSAVGALCMRYLVLTSPPSQPSQEARQQQQQLQRQIMRWAAISAVALLLVGFGLLIWQLILANEQIASASSWLEQGGQLLIGTFWGNLWIVRQSILLFFAAGLWFLSNKPQDELPLSLHLLIAGRSIDLLIVQALSSHQISGTSSFLLMLINVTTHLLAASVWMGSILVLALWMVPTILRKQRQAIVEGWKPIQWSQFTLFAAISVALLFASGLYSTGQQVASLDALLTTTYGQLLLGKIALVLLAGLSGLGNMLLVHPEAPRHLGRWLTQRIQWKLLARFSLSRLLLIEATLGLLILAASSLLSASAPPNNVAYTIDPAQIQPMRGQRVDNLLVTLSASPNRLGQNVFDLKVLRPQTPEQARILSVMLVFTYLGKPEKGETVIPPASVIAQVVDESSYQITGNYLQRPGDWQIDVRIAQEGSTGSVATFQWVVPPSGEIQPVWISKYPWKKLLSPTAALLAALFGSLVTVIYRQIALTSGKRQGASIAALSLLLLSLLYSALSPRQPAVAQAAPPTEAATTAVVAPAVQAQLAAASEQQMISVLVVLRHQADLKSIQVRSRSARLQQIVERLQAAAALTQPRIQQLLRTRQSEGKATPFHSLWILNGLAVNANPAVIRELAALPEVAEIRRNETIQAPPLPVSSTAVEPNLTLINAPALWDLGIDGTGIVVASLDTGVDLSHPELTSRWRGGSNSWFDPYGQHTTPADVAGSSSGHGTWTVGVMVGGDASGSAIGVAPGAQWIAAKIFDDHGMGSFENIHAAYQWLLDPDGNPNTNDAPQVVNNSWELLFVGCNLEFEVDFQVLRAANMLPIFAAGNDGPNPNSSVSPGNNPSAFAVGAIRNSGQIYNLSSRGPTTCGGSSRTYPDLVAPGVDIYTTALSGLYNVESGTSLAAPHVSGALALLLSAFPNLSAARQEAALLNGAIDLGDIGPDNKFGQGELNVLNSYQWLRDASPNQAPAVNAGADLSVTMPVSITLFGSVSDDGLPVSNTLAITWSVVSAVVSDSGVLSGSIPMTLGAPNHAVTTATIAAAGTYRLRLTANDGEFSSSDDRLITVAPLNHAPLVDAGTDLTLTLPLTQTALPLSTTISGSVHDDQLPAAASLVITWSVVSATNAATIRAPHSLTTTITFSTTGSYRLRLSADDGELLSHDERIITVRPPYYSYFPIVARQ